MSEFLDLAGLTRYDAAIKARAGAKLTISGSYEWHRRACLY